jgi:hypothetical protein
MAMNKVKGKESKWSTDWRDSLEIVQADHRLEKVVICTGDLDLVDIKARYCYTVPI